MRGLYVFQNVIIVAIVPMLVSCNRKGMYNGHEYVDLGLSVKWATCNIGASVPEESGDYFAWGDTEPLYEAGYAQEQPQRHWKPGRSDGYTCVNAPYQTNITTRYHDTTWSKYLGDTLSSFMDMNAKADNALKTVLDPEDDAAHVIWGGEWRMPTRTEISELLKNCSFKWLELNGVYGCRIQSKVAGYTNRWIFIPASDCLQGTVLSKIDGISGYFWANSILVKHPATAECFEFREYYNRHKKRIKEVLFSCCPRYFGAPIRPVFP